MDLKRDKQVFFCLVLFAGIGTIPWSCKATCPREACSTGYTGRDCSQRLSSEGDNTFLTADELESLKEQLKIDEGYRDEIYIDTEGYPTFGIGHLIRKTDEGYGKPVGTKVKDERIQEVFKADVHIAVQEVLAVFPNGNTFPGEVKEILVNMMFNLGQNRLKKFKNFIAAVNNRNWSKAADEMVDSKWYKQVGNRSKRLVARMRAVASATGN